MALLLNVHKLYSQSVSGSRQTVPGSESAQYGALITRLREQGGQVDDIRVYELMRDVRELALGIRVDGKKADWEGIPRAESVIGNVVDGSTDIVASAIAPLDHALYIAIYTRDKPTQKSWSWYVQLDVTAVANFDFQIGIKSVGPGNRFRVYTSHGETVRDFIEDIDVSIDEIVEIRIPWTRLAQLATQKPQEYAAELERQPFVRVTPFVWANSESYSIDEGTTIASYKLFATPVALDSTPPKPVNSFFSMDFPFQGKWFVSPGPWRGAHEWAYDMHRRDNSMATNFGSGKTPGEYYAWNQPVFSPVSGTVRRIVNDTPDIETPGTIPPGQGTNNGVFIDSADGYSIALVHFKYQSVVVSAGQHIQVGDLLGYTGNSGQSYQPHIHHGVTNKQLDETVPLQYRNVIVSLNPWANDPWARRLSTWLVRERVFVEPWQ
ncbi:MAG: M23 family metallopeptidase [Spirochaetes bacterium]|nr:M23 family metallopeptidase [Spirochaetota bacterium]